MRIDARANALFSQVLFLPHTTLAVGVLTFKAGSRLLLPTFAALPTERLAPARVMRSRWKCKQGGLSSRGWA